MHALIQGASPGEGLALVEALMADSNNVVFATCRCVTERLTELRQQQGERLHLLTLDVTDERTIAAAAAEVSQRCARLQLLVNVSGVLHGPNMQPERRLEQVNGEALAISFAVHATGPLLMAKRRRKNSGDSTISVRPSDHARLSR
jgi:NAD(P)-dependent dehydrogenase (short-subunit alcohol dehydrogenase family)